MVIIQYGDFQCPYCRELADIFRNLNDEYEGEIAIVWKDFPLHQIHDQSLNAAKAARCAQKQDKFWQMHDLLFQNQKKLTDDLYVPLASGLDLDTDEFIQCVNNNETLALIQKDIEEGTSLGVQGTPHFFVNNYEITELIEEEELKDIIDSLL
ncbi:MAG: DsbA family protein [Patescibacteria group bacterium]|nr:DsbA family protein [Patescibacteria group bacterium]